MKREVEFRITLRDGTAEKCVATLNRKEINRLVQYLSTEWHKGSISDYSIVEKLTGESR